MKEFLNRWPLLLVGLSVIAYGVVELRDSADPSDARALVLGLGAVMLGAGLALVVWRQPDEGASRRPELETETKPETEEERS